MTLCSQDKLFQLMEEATTQGFRLELHVIGDDGAEAALDGLAYAKVTPEKRPILTHCQALPSVSNTAFTAYTDSVWHEPKLLPIFMFLNK